MWNCISWWLGTLGASLKKLPSRRRGQMGSFHSGILGKNLLIDWRMRRPDQAGFCMLSDSWIMSSTLLGKRRIVVLGRGPHCEKRVSFFPSPAGKSLIKTPLGRELLNYSQPGRVWLVTSRLGTGKWKPFYTVQVQHWNSCPGGTALSHAGLAELTSLLHGLVGRMTFPSLT